MKNNKHYVCTGGCEGLSDKSGVCQAEDCPDHGKSLRECGCADGSHNTEDEEKDQEGGFTGMEILIALGLLAIMTGWMGVAFKEEISDFFKKAPAPVEEIQPTVNNPFPARPVEEKPLELPKEPVSTDSRYGTPIVQPAPAPAPAPKPVTATGEWHGQYTVTAPPECKGETGGWQAFLSENGGVISGEFSADAGVSGSVGGSRSGDTANWSVRSGGASGIGFSGAITSNTMSGNFTGLTCYKNEEKRRSTGTYFGGRIVQ
ncbi:MAG: hypothetical protein HZB99_02105 [Candidatus Harrisonbacteria bacterium]|nr:hypothetical protein [Candidatus Harrisonbacteria bacterium]